MHTVHRVDDNTHCPASGSVYSGHTF